MKKYYLFTLLTITTLLFTSCYTWFQEKIPIDNSTLQTNLADFLYEEVAQTSLKAPTQVLASQGMYSKTIKVRWDEVPNAKAYRIERAIVVPDANGEYTIPDDGDFNYLDKIMSNLYIDTIIKDDTYDEENNNEALYKNLYFYRISAENIIQGYDSSEFTKIEESDTKAIGWLLSAPQKVNATKGKSQDGITISWEPVLNAKKYEIYRNTKNSDLGFELLKSVNASRTSYFNTIDSEDRGKDFYYQVKAILPENSESEFSERALGYAKKEGATEPPAEITVTNGKAQSKDFFTISWTPSEPADSVHTKITYSLFRSSSESSAIKLIKQGLTSTNFTDLDNISENVVYKYFIQTVAANPLDSKDIVKSAFSEEIDSAKGWIISAPKTFEVLKSDNPSKVILKFPPAMGYETVDFAYRIYSSEFQEDETFTPISEDIPASALTLSNGYYTYEISRQKFFKIRTINPSAGNLESKLSDITAPNPESPQNLSATKTSGSNGLLSYTPNTNEVYPVRITWNKPANDIPYGYNIYRSTKADSSYRKLNDSPITTAENGLFSFIDENDSARAGTIYYYKVISLNELGKGKPLAEETLYSSGYGAVTREQWFREYNKSIMSSQAKLTLMHKSNDMDKLGSETISGNYGGTLSYKAAIAGLGAEITMHYENYCDFYIGDDSSLGKYFVLTGNTDTTSNMSANGNMHEKVNCTGMYPGYAIYNNLQIKGGAAGGGYYLVETYDLSGKVNLKEDKVDWLVGEDH